MKNFIIYMVTFVPIWMCFYALADFVFMFESRAYTMTFGVIAFLISHTIASKVANKYEDMKCNGRKATAGSGE